MWHRGNQYLLRCRFSRLRSGRTCLIELVHTLSFFLSRSVTLEQLVVRFLICAIANSGKQIKDRGVADQPQHVASPDQYGCTTFAPFEMLVHPSAQASTDLVLQVIRDLAPNLVTTDVHCPRPACLPLLRLVFHTFWARLSGHRHLKRYHLDPDDAALVLPIKKAASCHSPKNSIQPIQRFHRAIWIDT